eukprot:6187977-Pleurochrysis_carterae.AAC.2
MPSPPQEGGKRDAGARASPAGAHSWRRMLVLSTRRRRHAGRAWEAGARARGRGRARAQAAGCARVRVGVGLPATESTAILLSECSWPSAQKSTPSSAIETPRETPGATRLWLCARQKRARGARACVCVRACAQIVRAW